MTTIKANESSNSKAIIKDIKKSSIVATGEKFIDVEVWIYDGDEKVESKKLGYPYATTKDEIVEDVKKLVALRDAEKAKLDGQKVIDEEEENADKTVDGLKDLEIK